MEYILHILIMINIYTILVLSANLPVGMANLLSICQAAFYGIGAYAGAYLLLQFDLPFLIIAFVVLLVTGISSLLVSLASVKLKEDYFVLATLSFQMIIYSILYNWISVTNGPYGIVGIPRIKLFGIWPLQGYYSYFIFTFILTIGVIIAFKFIKYSPFGRILSALRSDEISVAALGRDPNRFKSIAYLLSASFSGLGGLLYASYISYIDPTSFTLDESIFILTALFIGGVGNIRGPVLGAVFVIIIPEIFRFIGLPDTLAANLRQIIYGLLLILIMYFRPQGLLGKIIIR